MARGRDLQSGKGRPDAIWRHTALTALAQLRTAAVRAAITGAITLPAAPACANTTAAAGGNTASDAELQFCPGGAPLPGSAGQPCPPDIAPMELSVTETARIERLASD